jgi:hypothetical protein
VSILTQILGVVKGTSVRTALESVPLEVGAVVTDIQAISEGEGNYRIVVELCNKEELIRGMSPRMFREYREVLRKASYDGLSETENA